MTTTITSAAIKTPAAPRPRGPHRAWVVVAAAWLTIVAAGAYSTMSGLLVEPLSAEYGWSRSSIGLAASLSMVLNGLVAPFSAALMDRYGMRRIAVTALALLAAGAGLTTVVGAPWQFVLAWGALTGLGTGVLALTFAAMVVQRWFVARRGLVTGVLTAAGVFGQFVFLPVLSWITDHAAWQTALAVLAGAALVSMAVTGLLLRDHPADAGVSPYGADAYVPKPQPAPGAAARTVRVLLKAARTGPFWLLAGTFVVCGATTNGIMWTHFTPAAHDHGMPATAASSLLAMIGVFNVAGTIFSGWLTDRLDPRRLLAAYYALRGASLLTLPLLLGPAVHGSLIAFVILFGLLDVATVPPTLALLREHYGADTAVVFGWVSAAHQAGAGLMAVSGGLVRDVFGTYDPMWVAAGALCAVAALVAMVVRRPRVSRS
ncbi:MFS transporter [Streptomyces boninensis]|uniref:MFS transporter n=1 Tax=Streptomyces boninensis TaxID=2039455 RepID=UPI003B20CA87